MSSTQPTRIATNKLKTNPNNPRTIRKDQLEKLVKSLREFPEMLEARPIVVDPDYVVLGGNMRLKAAQEAGLKEVPVYIASWEEAKHKEFVIKDNLAFGEWDWDMLANEWDAAELNDWGLNVWQPEVEIDLSVLEEAEDVEHMADDVRRAVCIDFNMDDHAVVSAKVAALKKEGKDVGKMILKWMSQA